MMIETTDRRITIFRIFLGIIVLVWSFLVIREGFYMDESGILSIYKGLHQGNRMFIDSWGGHQLGWILVTPVLELYYQVLEPIIYPLGCGFVLYMRICYQVIRLIIAVYLYFTIRKTRFCDSAFIGALLYYMFFVSFKNLSYKSMCEMAIMLFICWTYRYFSTKKIIYFILSAVATCAAILAYPSMILFPVFFVIYLFVLMFKGYELLKPTVLYCATCFVLGIAVVIYIQLTSGIQNVLPQLKYTEDAAYKYPLYMRVGFMLLSYLFFMAIAYAPIVFMKLFSIIRYVDEVMTQRFLAIYWILFFAAIILLRPESVSTSRYIHGCLVIFFWFIYFTTRKEKSDYTQVGKYKLLEYDEKHMLRFILFVSVVVQFIWSMTTNQEVTVPGHMCIYAVIALMVMIDDDFEGLRLLKVVFVCASIFFMGIWIAESDGGYNDIFETRYYVTDGAYKGIALDDVDYQMNQSCYNLVSQYVTSEDYLYVVNSYGATGYLNSDARQASGSPFSRVGVGQLRVLEYWQENPDNQADYILIDTANKYYEEFLQGETAEYIFANYPETVATDGNVILLTR